MANISSAWRFLHRTVAAVAIAVALARTASYAQTIPADRAVPPAAGPTLVSFTPYATFFSRLTRRSRTVDPFVFVRDPTVLAGVGPANVAHPDDVRPARTDDPPNAPLLDAKGVAMHVRLGRWFAGQGYLKHDALAAGDLVSTTFTRLVPGGVYSLFAVEFRAGHAYYSPLDGTGETNSFRADRLGAAAFNVRTVDHLRPRDGVALVYHSDDASHGPTRGTPGLDAHVQLMAILVGPHEHDERLYR